MSDHNPVRPGWRCGGCGQPWPCGTRRSQLAAEYEGARVSLALLMSTSFCAAAQDLPDVRAGDLYLRFLGWLDPYRRGDPGPARRG
ncbi:hypothetical protein [Planosporangium mesophilum]|uniref:Flavin reductase n=1 Tax=Planosporangium mesophilum TaxID=689768 RepID=A0A8J3TE62_9ACTN|nr:hypothetical protein [Planosporangium mesophilum]NJC82516.1 hypothetical protein [Planosporangium mesophilum]GII25480.1 hypothetical protein Pme01_50770 [Planosporangium mesophilum]